MREAESGHCRTETMLQQQTVPTNVQSQGNSHPRQSFQEVPVLGHPVVPGTRPVSSSRDAARVPLTRIP